MAPETSKRGLAARQPNRGTIFEKFITLWICASIFLAVASAEAGSLAGIDPPGLLLTVEDHSEVLCRWYKEGFRDRILVHFDEHGDFHSEGINIKIEKRRLVHELESRSCDSVKPLITFPVRTNALYNDNNFVFAAHEAGIIREVYWVISSRKALNKDGFDFYREGMKGLYPDEFVDSLVFRNGQVTGNYQGMPVTILVLEMLPDFAEPVLMDIDTDFFIGIAENPVKGGMLEALGWFFANLRSKKLPSNCISVGASTRRQSTPHRFRYLFQWLTELLSNPGRYKPGPPEIWKKQQHVEYLSFMLAWDEAMEENRRLSVLLPESGLPHFNLSLMAGERGNLKEALEHIGRAVAKDKGYSSGYIEMARELARIGRIGDAIRSLEAGIDKVNNQVDLQLELGSLYLQSARTSDAKVLYEKLIEYQGDIPIAYSGLAFALWQLGKQDHAREVMNTFRIKAHPGIRRDNILAAWQNMTKVTKMNGN